MSPRRSTRSRSRSRSACREDFDYGETITRKTPEPKTSSRIAIAKKPVAKKPIATKTPSTSKPKIDFSNVNTIKRLPSNPKTASFQSSPPKANNDREKLPVRPVQRQVSFADEPITDLTTSKSDSTSQIIHRRTSILINSSTTLTSPKVATKRVGVVNPPVGAPPVRSVHFSSVPKPPMNFPSTSMHARPNKSILVTAPSTTLKGFTLVNSDEHQNMKKAIAKLQEQNNASSVNVKILTEVNRTNKANIEALKKENSTLTQQLATSKLNNGKFMKKNKNLR